MKNDEKPNVPLWLQYALEELGISESGQVAENPKILNYFKEVDHPDITKDETPWCAAFVGAMLERSNLKSTKSLMARSYLDWGQKCGQAKLGTIAVFKRGNSKVLGHVGFVMDETENHIQLLSGNQNNKVSIAAYNKDKLLGLRWPSIEGEKKEDLNRGNENNQKISAFDIALEHVLKMEGGWSNHKDDPGGPTYKGITLNTFQKAVREGLIEQTSSEEVKALKNLTKSQITKIYEQLYWRQAGCQYFHLPIAISLFDAAVNHGPSRAVKLLQTAIGAEVDGEVGPETIQKAKASYAKQTLSKFISVRRSYYKNLRQFSIFGKGWMNRLDETEEIANRYLANNLFPPEKFSTPIRKVKPKMNTPHMNDKTKWWGESLTVWGTIVTALSTILPIIGPFIGLDISAELIQQFGDTVAKLIQIIGGITGTSMALYGRARASTKLTRRSMEVKV